MAIWYVDNEYIEQGYGSYLQLQIQLPMDISQRGAIYGGVYQPHYIHD